MRRSPWELHSHEAQSCFPELLPIEYAGLQIAGQEIGIRIFPSANTSRREAIREAKKLRGIPALLVEIGVLLAEAIDTAGGIKKTLFSGEEGMAGGADFHMHVFALGRKSFYLIAAGTGDFGLVHFWMNLVFHNLAPIKSGLSHIYLVVPFGKWEQVKYSYALSCTDRLAIKKFFCQAWNFQ